MASGRLVALVEGIVDQSKIEAGLMVLGIGGKPAFQLGRVAEPRHLGGQSQPCLDGRELGRVIAAFRRARQHFARIGLVAEIEKRFRQPGYGLEIVRSIGEHGGIDLGRALKVARAAQLDRRGQRLFDGLGIAARSRHLVDEFADLAFGNRAAGMDWMPSWPAMAG